MKLDPHSIVVVVGLRGAGKSTWIRDYLLADSDGATIWDPRREYGEVADVVCSPAELAEILNGETDGLTISVQPTSGKPRDLADEFELFSDAMVAYERPGLIVLEELVLLRRHGDAVDALVTQSRHWRAPVALVSQRAAMIPKTSRTQADHVISFAQRDPDDVAALVELCGLDAGIVLDYRRYQWFQWSLESDLDRPGEKTNPNAEHERAVDDRRDLPRRRGPGFPR